jgi:hypothetical protein
MIVIVCTFLVAQDKTQTVVLYSEINCNAYDGISTVIFLYIIDFE